MDPTEAPAGVVLDADTLSPEALRGLIEDFVTRDGTDYGAVEASLETKIAQVAAQLARAEVVVVFDPESETASIVVSPAEPR